jgi:hypothetical protein
MILPALGCADIKRTSVMQKYCPKQDEQQTDTERDPYQRRDEDEK